MTRTSRLLWAAASAAFLLACTSLTWAETTNVNQWRNVAFDTPAAFSKPIDAGMDAVSFIDPPESGIGKGRMEITLVAVPKDLRESLGSSDAEVLNYVKATYLATSGAAEKTVERTILGKKSVGEALSVSIPVKRGIELHLAPLSTGDQICIAFARDQAMPEDQAEATRDMATRTFREIKGK